QHPPCAIQVGRSQRHSRTGYQDAAASRSRSMSPIRDLLLTRIDDRGGAGRIAYLTVNNPTRRNALGMAGKRAIAESFNRLAQDDQLRAAVITGAGDK